MADGQEDFGVQANRLRDNSGDGGADSKDNPLEASSDVLTRILGFLGIKINLSTIPNVGLLAQATPKQSIIDKPMNQGASSLNVRGGSGVNLLAKGAQLHTARDFSKIAKPAIDGFPVQSMSYGSLGNLTPMDSGGSGRSGIGLA